MTEPDAAGVDPSRISDSLPMWDLAFVAPESGDAALVPVSWQPILQAATAGERCRLARALWNSEFLGLLPRFAATLQDQLLDVRVCLTDDTVVLVYVTAGEDRLVSWVGYDPRSFGNEPPLFTAVHPALRTFLHEVHAGFVTEEREAYGPMRPRHINTLANLTGYPDGIPDWDEHQSIASTRLLRITTNSGNLDYCVSPDLPSDQIALVYEGDIDPQDLGSELDELMARLYEE